MFKLGNNFMIGKSTELDIKDMRYAAEFFTRSTKAYAERLGQFEHDVINTNSRELGNKVNVRVISTKMVKIFTAMIKQIITSVVSPVKKDSKAGCPSVPRDLNDRPSALPV